MSTCHSRLRIKEPSPPVGGACGLPPALDSHACLLSFSGLMTAGLATVIAEAIRLLDSSVARFSSIILSHEDR